MHSNPHSNLSRFYRFFETYGTERLNGLDESHFYGLSANEKEEAWDFLKNSRALSTERIRGLYLLDKARAVELFKQLVAAPLKESEFPAERQAAENSRLAMLSYIYSVDPEETCVSAMCEFANSEFSRVRAAFAQTLPIDRTTPEAVDALKRMIFTEIERIPLTSAITKLMVIHGLDYDINNPLYDSIYLSLRSDNPKEKAGAMSRLEKIQCPNYF
ncbi:hypothetical protein [Massilia varians]|uniref:hypothetical protein n=1 Tax=Massilia varians TaxID=457921 RepID=UPI002552BFFD|nr:hypothetical protein [Massilia varians]MDK6079996.1 hypothetical protein [Massilia varians]